jgi:hypothetical protein
MAIKKTFNGATIIKPGAYSKIVVENLTGFPLQSTGVVGIIGEAVGGEPRVLDILNGTGIQAAKARYKEGPIADALELIANPSRDPRIPNGASTIVVYKVNNGTKGSVNLKNDISSPVNMLEITSKNWGSDENLINLTVSQGEIVDQNAKISGTVSGPFNMSGAPKTLVLDVAGTTYTYTSTLSGVAETAAAVVADLNNVAAWAPAKPVIASIIPSTQKVQIVLDPAVVTGAKHDYGYIWVDEVASTADTILGITGEARGKKGSRIFEIKKGTLEEISPELGGVDQFKIKYTGTGTAATLDFKIVSNELRLTTNVTGAPADNLDILIRDADGKVKHTLKTLADVIVATGVYSAEAVGPNKQRNADELDFYDDIPIKRVYAYLRADLQDIEDYLTTFSSLVSASRIDNIYRGLATFSSPQFLAGATDGSSTNSDWADAFDAFKEERINVVVPLISKDIGPLSISSINASAADHAAWGWSTTGKSERSCFVSFRGSKAAFKNACRDLNSAYVVCVGQEVRVLNRSSELEWKDPWALACILAGLRAGAEVGEPLTFKVINVNDVRAPLADFDPKKDYQELIEAGCTIVEPLDTGGFRCVLGNTTYGIDPSFVWNRESVVQAAGYVAYDLRYNLELAFTGTKARTGSAEAMANFIKSRMSAYLNADIIVGDDDNEGLGYKNLSVVIEGNTAIINVSITPVQGIDFILPTIYLADIRQSA